MPCHAACRHQQYDRHADHFDVIFITVDITVEDAAYRDAPPFVITPYAVVAYIPLSRFQIAFALYACSAFD